MITPHKPPDPTLTTNDFLQNPPTYNPLAIGSGSSLQVSTLPRPPPDLLPTNYIHVRDYDNPIKQNVPLDLSILPPPIHVLSTGTQGSGNREKHIPSTLRTQAYPRCCARHASSMITNRRSEVRVLLTSMDGSSRICGDSTAKYRTNLFTAVSLPYRTVTYIQAAS